MMDGHAGKYAAQVILHTILRYNEKPTAEGKKQQCFLPKSYGTLNFQQLDTKIFCLMLLKQVIALGATRRYAPPCRWQFKTRRIYIRQRMGSQSTHP